MQNKNKDILLSTTHTLAVIHWMFYAVSAIVWKAYSKCHSYLHALKTSAAATAKSFQAYMPMTELSCDENWTNQRSARISLGPLHYYAGSTHITAIFILYAVLLQRKRNRVHHPGEKKKKKTFKGIISKFEGEKKSKNKKGTLLVGWNYCQEIFTEMIFSSSKKQFYF